MRRCQPCYAENVKRLRSADLTQRDLPAREQCPEHHTGRVRARQHALCPDARLELLVQPLTVHLKTARHPGTPQVPSCEKKLSAGKHQSGSASAHHRAVVCRELIVQILWRMSDQVAQLVPYSAAPPHSATSPASAASRPLPPSMMTSSGRFRPRDSRSCSRSRQAASLSGQRSQSQQHLLPVGSHAKGHQDRQRGALPIEAHVHHGTVEDQPHDRLTLEAAAIPALEVPLHPAPGATDGVFAHRPAKELSER